MLAPHLTGIVQGNPHFCAMWLELSSGESFFKPTHFEANICKQVCTNQLIFLTPEALFDFLNSWILLHLPIFIILSE